MSELETLFSEPKKISVADKEILIKTISLGDIPLVLGIFSKISEAMKGQKKNAEIDQALIAKVLGQNFDEALKLLVVTTDLPEDQIKKLNIAAALKLISAVVKENADFLQQQVVPMAKGLMSELGSLNKSKNS